MDIPSYLSSGEFARLIPVAADTKREARATSVLMATLSAVPSFGSSMLAGLGQRMGARADLGCFTEIVLKNDVTSPRCRPDGLLVLDGGRGRTWSCLIEAKIGNADLAAGQVERYASLARTNGIDAVLTISNQFVALPAHSPTRVPRSALRGVDLFHWSWTYVLTQALLQLNNDAFERPEQRYILEEMTRYFSHPSIGVTSFDRMNPEWKDLVARVQAGAAIGKADLMVENTVAAWHQESRDLCLMMARKLYRQVRLRLPKTHVSDPLLRMKADCDKLVTDHKLECTLEIPDAAAPLVIAADLLRRSLSVSMTLGAPGDKQRAVSRINWIVRQLAKADPANIYVRALWPGRTQPTQASLLALRQDPSCLEVENKNVTPNSFDVMLIYDIAGKFGGTRTFLEQLETAVPAFYEQVGQHVRAYVAPPPRIPQQKDESLGLKPSEVDASDLRSGSSESDGEGLRIVREALTEDGAEVGGSGLQTPPPDEPTSESIDQRS